MPRWLRLAALALLALGAAGSCWLYYFLYWAPLPPSLAEMKPLTTVYLDTKGRLIAEIAGPDARSHRPVSLAEMGPWIPAVMVEMEDRRFYSHGGVDAWGTARAFIEQRGGGSTITQQLVKIATGRKGRSLVAKAREALLALQLERRWPKEKILVAYLNRIPFGNRLIGVEAASQAYFNKPAALLTKAEAIYLAALPREPSLLNPWTHPAAAEKRFDGSRQLLTSRGFLNTQEGAEMSPPVVERHLPVNAAPHFIQLAARTGHIGRTGVVRCTLDLDIQHSAEQMVRENLDLLHRPDITEAAMVVIENDTGAVRALVGSRDFKKQQVDGATLFRNSGSTLKPFLYVTGIDTRVFTAATLLPDTAEAVRDVYMDYDPHNFVLSHLGPVRVREALGNSLNVPAVVAVGRIGARNAYNAIAGWGVKFDRPLEKAGAGFILGNVGVRLIDLTSAFSGLARGGLAGPPKFIEEETIPLHRMVSPDADSIVVDIMCDNSARLQGFGRRSSIAFPVRIAAKTGTSAGFRDTWTVGFTREHTVGVWMGNFDGRSMDHAASAASAAPLWRRMIDDLLAQTDHPIPEPALARVPICSLTGLLPCAASRGVVRELFLPGTEPRESAAGWFAGDGHLLLPKEYAGWCDSGDNILGATVRPEKEDLAILNPRDGAVFKLDTGIPLAQQQVEFQANIPDGVTWTMNGAPLAADTTGHVLWQLKEGDWTLEADNGVVRAKSRFSVRKE